MSTVRDFYNFLDEIAPFAAQEVIENTLFFLFDLLCSDKCALTSRHTSDILHIE